MRVRLIRWVKKGSCLEAYNDCIYFKSPLNEKFYPAGEKCLNWHSPPKLGHQHIDFVIQNVSTGKHTMTAIISTFTLAGFIIQKTTVESLRVDHAPTHQAIDVGIGKN